MGGRGWTPMRIRILNANSWSVRKTNIWVFFWLIFEKIFRIYQYFGGTRGVYGGYTGVGFNANLNFKCIFLLSTKNYSLVFFETLIYLNFFEKSIFWNFFPLPKRFWTWHQKMSKKKFFFCFFWIHQRMIYNVTVSEILKTAGVIESVFPVHYVSPLFS